MKNLLKLHGQYVCLGPQHHIVVVRGHLSFTFRCPSLSNLAENEGEGSGKLISVTCIILCQFLELEINENFF